LSGVQTFSTAKTIKKALPKGSAFLMVPLERLFFGAPRLVTPAFGGRELTFSFCREFKPSPRQKPLKKRSQKGALF